MFRKRSSGPDAQTFADDVAAIRFVPLGEFSVEDEAGATVRYAIRLASCERVQLAAHAIPRRADDPGTVWAGYHRWDGEPYKAKVLVREGAVLTSRAAALLKAGDRYVAHPRGCRGAEAADLEALAAELPRVRAAMRDLVLGQVIHLQRAGRGPSSSERTLLRVRFGLS